LFKVHWQNGCQEQKEAGMQKVGKCFLRCLRRGAGLCGLAIAISLDVTWAADPLDRQSLEPLPPAAPAARVKAFVLTAEEVAVLKKGGLLGSAEDAKRLALFYDMAEQNQEQGLRWYTICAENGDVVCQYNLGFLLSKADNEDERLRARYWLEVAISRGYEPARGLLRRTKEREGH
jgi:TPR repeat protein